MLTVVYFFHKIMFLVLNSLTDGAITSKSDTNLTFVEWKPVTKDPQMNVENIAPKPFSRDNDDNSIPFIY